MRLLLALAVIALPLPAIACGAPVCLVDPDSLSLPQTITFNETRSGAGPGHPVEEVLALQGAKFGERFAGQQLIVDGTHDAIEGPALGPLTVLAGTNGQNLSVVNSMGVSVLMGYGSAGFPKRDAQGEGAIAILFDEDQSALALDVRGGEKGRGNVLFLRRDGAVLALVPVQPLGEFELGFYRTNGAADIAGLVLTNRDPQGIALDTIRFGKHPDLS